jgi:hypothetical protein
MPIEAGPSSKCLPVTAETGSNARAFDARLSPKCMATPGSLILDRLRAGIRVFRSWIAKFGKELLDLGPKIGWAGKQPEIVQHPLHQPRPVRTDAGQCLETEKFGSRKRVGEIAERLEAGYGS